MIPVDLSGDSLLGGRAEQGTQAGVYKKWQTQPGFVLLCGSRRNMAALDIHPILLAFYMSSRNMEAGLIPLPQMFAF